MDNKYQSKYGAGAITPAQYIIEKICEKKAQISKQTLTYKFWKQPEWAIFFKRHLRQVHALLRKYDAAAIINAFSEQESGMKWSLNTPFMLDIIKKQQKKLNKAKKRTLTDEEIMQMDKLKTGKQTRRPSLNHNMLDVLDDTLDVLDADIEYSNVSIIDG